MTEHIAAARDGDTVCSWLSAAATHDALPARTAAGETAACGVRGVQCGLAQFDSRAAARLQQQSIHSSH